MNNPNSILIFGAGKIGRSFIGQIFGLAGYEVIFVEIDKSMVEALNRRGSYPVVIKGIKEEVIRVPNVRALCFYRKEEVAREVSTASLLAVSVGPNALGRVIPQISRGIRKRYQSNPDQPVDIIIAENMRDAASYMKERLIPQLPVNYPAGRLLGLVETSIGKMVPIMPEEELEKDPLKVFAEPYNELILDGTAFKGSIPDVKELAPKSNMKAWVDRKAFIHNPGHATAAYMGAYQHPEAKYLYEVLRDGRVYNFTREVMQQASLILLAEYPDDFSRQEPEDQTDDLLKRFGNRALGDTLFRAGRDIMRKLGPDDRFMGIIRMAQPHGLAYGKILEAMIYGLLFRGKDESGKPYPGDVSMAGALSEDPGKTIDEVCGLHVPGDEKMIRECKYLYVQLNKSPG